MTKNNPFQVKSIFSNNNSSQENCDPLDVRDLLTDNTHKAVITEDGELKIKEKSSKNKPSVELMKERYWGGNFRALTDKRIALETREMRARFAKFKLYKATKDFCVNNWTVAHKGELYWIGNIKTHSQRNYKIAVVYPNDYPCGEIRAYVLKPYIPVVEHRFQDGHLCLYDHGGEGDGYEKEKTTAVTIIAWTSAWIHAYEIWRITGEWPTMGESQ